ncbi:DUF3365 domain-containing protein [Thioalkalivibrio sp. ALJ24]|uniref:Tll0287-like domain-containing protein n=1 Tax=Thioalkalivibrio sp. ALJ24 TaxID=545276 RepID=UPI0004781CD2|nr:DUF3365 domain-containing protein [Thioalkalivibrio sp. ALJ24]
MNHWKLAPIALGIAALAAGCANHDEAATSDEAATEVSEEEIEQRAADSREAIQQFASTLQGELMAAMEEGGPTEAIQVCNEVAPEIAADISADTGWDVGRTSLKLRNPDNAPDEWERAVLEGFDAEVAAGTPADEIAPSHEVVQTDEGARFRFMAAIPTGGECLACHGAEVDSDIKHALERLYPEDEATGYEAGQVRGAFTITQEM